MIAIAKLTNNMTIIGDLHDNGDFTDCLMIQIMNNPQMPDQFNVMLLPVFAPISEDKVAISADKVLTSITAPDNLKNEYTRITTGLVIANQNDISQLGKVRPIFGKK